MTRALYIDDQRVDLPEDVRFQLTFQIADFGELKPRGSGSNTIKLPKTPRNIAIFDNCNFVQVSSNFPYALHSAYYYEDGWLIFNDATVYMLAITEKDFEIQCVWGNSTEIRRLKSLDMGNVAGLGNVNYQPATYGLVETGMKGIYGNIESFYLATRGNGYISEFTRGVLSIRTALDNIPNFNPEYSPAIAAYLDHLYAFPAVKQAKISYKNAVFEGQIISSEIELEDVVIGGRYSVVLSSDPLKRKKAFFLIENTNRTITTQGGTPFDGIVAPFTLPGGWYDISVEISNIVFTYPDTSTDALGGIFVIGQVLAGNDNSKYTADSNSSLVIDIGREWVQGKTYSGSKRIYIDDAEIDMGNDIKAVPELYCAIWPNFSVPSVYKAFVTANLKITVNSVSELTEVDINMPDETKEGVKNYITIGLNDLLRGTNAYDFITQAVINAGAIFDSKDGKTRVYTYDDVVNNTAEMLDWSDKLVYIKEENTFNQSGGSQNEIKYKQDEYYNGFGDGSFADPLAQELKKDDKTLVENSLFGFNNGLLVYGLGNPIKIPFVEEKADKNGIKSYNYRESGWHLVKLAEPADMYMANKNGQWIRPSIKALRGNATQPTFDNITETNWLKYIVIQQNYRKAKALFMLTPQDVAQLDFKKPIYLRQYAQAYIVTKINYQRNASTVEMLLIR